MDARGRTQVCVQYKGTQIRTLRAEASTKMLGRGTMFRTNTPKEIVGTLDKHYQQYDTWPNAVIVSFGF